MRYRGRVRRVAGERVGAEVELEVEGLGEVDRRLAPQLPPRLVVQVECRALRVEQPLAVGSQLLHG